MKKGISLVVLAITIIAMVIMLGVIVISSNFILQDTEFSKAQLDIAQLQTLMSIYKMRNSGKIDFETTTFNTTTLSSAELAQFEGERIVNNKVTLYVVDLDKIDASNINLGQLERGTDDRYLYSLTTGKVYYERGIKTDDTTYYYIQKEG